jgi:hypothetical protein
MQTCAPSRRLPCSPRATASWPYRRLLAASARRLTDRGALLVQFRGRVVEATCCDFDDLLTDLEERALAA